MLTHKGAAVTDPLCLAATFNDHFSSIAEKTKVKVKFSNNIMSRLSCLMKSRYL